MKARIGFAAKIVIGGKKQLKKSCEIFFSEARGLLGESWALIGWSGDQIGISTAHTRDEKITKMANHLAAKVLEILSFADEAMDEAERALGGLGGDGFDEFIKHAFGDDAEKFADLRIGDFIAGVGDGLFEE